MTHQELLDLLVSLSPGELDTTIKNQQALLFDRAFVDFLRGELNASRDARNPGSKSQRFFSAIDSDVADLLRTEMDRQAARVHTVWERIQVHAARISRSASSGRLLCRAHSTNRCTECNRPLSGSGLCRPCLVARSTWQQSAGDHAQHRRSVCQDSYPPPSGRG